MNNLNPNINNNVQNNNALNNGYIPNNYYNQYQNQNQNQNQQPNQNINQDQNVDSDEEKKRKKKQKIIIVIIIISVVLVYSMVFVKYYNAPVNKAAKPIIYLYPEEEIEVSVRLGKPEKITCSYPKYGNGWDVVAKPDGTLIDKDTNRELYSLCARHRRTLSG